MLVVSSVRASAIGRVRMMVATSADTVCSVIQKMFLRGLNIVRCLPVVTLNSFWGFLLCIYRDGLVVEFFEVWVGGGEVAAGGFGGNAAAGAGFFFVGWLGLVLASAVAAVAAAAGGGLGMSAVAAGVFGGLGVRLAAAVRRARW